MRQPSTRSSSQPALRPLGIITTFNGWSVFLAGVTLAVMGPMVLGLIADAAAKQSIKPTGIAAPFLAHPTLIMLVAAPAIVGGLWAVRRLPGRWLALIIAALAAIAGVGLMLASLIALLGPLYEYKSL